MDREKYIEDLRDIKTIMSRSGRFISLSGLSGISTGLIALMGLYLAHRFVFQQADLLQHQPVALSHQLMQRLLLIAGITLLLSIAAAVWFTIRKARKQQQAVWDIRSKKLLAALLIPLATGAVLCLLFLVNGFAGVLPSLTLIFYGLALVSASGSSFSELRNLGLIQIVLGLLAFHFITYALHCWALGFGLAQMLYGLIIQLKYKA